MGDLHIESLTKFFYLSHVKGPRTSLEEGQNPIFCPMTHTHQKERKEKEKGGTCPFAQLGEPTPSLVLL
jgi:hypothetical protein